jgi:hypothetical protein
MHPSAMNPTTATIGLRIRNPFTTAKTDSALHTTKNAVVDRGSAPAKWAAAFLLVTTAVDVEVITARGDRLYVLLGPPLAALYWFLALRRNYVASGPGWVYARQTAFAPGRWTRVQN